uniref:Thioredoxin domain-containing protein n=1 Tax=Strigamia maritima TaxID=126957 RepID=T1JD07_STRMM
MKNIIINLCICLVVLGYVGGVGETETEKLLESDVNPAIIPISNENEVNDEILENATMPAVASVSLVNETVVIEENVNITTKATKVDCKARELSVDENPTVFIVNSSVMLGAVVPETNISANECALVLFFAPWCHFSALAAPHFNALARLYPTFHLFAINAIKFNGLNTRYGIAAVPTLVLFHNGRAIAKFNETVYSLDNFVQFVGKYTSSQTDGIINVTSADFFGPLPSTPSNETDYVLIIVWTFIFACATFGFVKSTFCCRIVEVIRNNWREAEAQHEHVE